MGKNTTRIITSLICLALLFQWLPEPFNPYAEAKSSAPAFSTSFEKQDPPLTWKNTAETSRSGKILSSGVKSQAAAGTKSADHMNTSIGAGPSSMYAAADKAGWSGQKTLRFSGVQDSKGAAYAYNKIYRIHIKVKKDTQLSYYLAPEFTDKKRSDYSGTYVSVDLAFSDGTYLHQLQAKDQDGIRMTPRAQGQSKTLYMNQWNFKKSTIGKVAAGKTITRILIAYNAPKGPGKFKGSIDDIRIGAAQAIKKTAKPVDYVNILRGTASSKAFSRGGTVPAVAVPNGFNFWAPATDSSSANAVYQYNQNNDTNNLPEIQSFSLLHALDSQTGETQAFQVMPSDFIGTPSANRVSRGLAFKHSNESAKPNDYHVAFENGIKADVAPAGHSAIFRFTFKDGDENLIFDNLNNNGGLTLRPKEKALYGYSDLKNGSAGGASRLFFYATFDKKIIDSSSLSGEDRDHVTAFYKFDASGGKTVTMRIATSLISVAQAKRSLNQEIGPKKSFNDVKQAAEKAWDKQLNKVTVEGANQDQLTTLYSNMYRLFLYPNAAYENAGTARKPKYQYASPYVKSAGKNTAVKTGAKVKNGRLYVNSDFEYSAQTAWPAYSLLAPKLTGDFIDGYLKQYKDSGRLSPAAETGTDADLAFADAYLSGVTTVNARELYQAILKDTSVNSGAEAGRAEQNKAIFNGYTSTAAEDSVNWTLTGSMNDFALSNLGSVLYQNRSSSDPYGDQYKDDSDYFAHRAQNYIQLFNRKSGFFMGKSASGKWQPEAKTFDPKSWNNKDFKPNGWNLAFLTPQDGQGLANLYGGREKLADKLDTFFSTAETAADTKKTTSAMRETRDGRLGMLNFGSPSAQSIPYMYNSAGEPWKTQARVRSMMTRFYAGSEIGQGYLGDDKNGALSAWYLLSAAGLYPEAGTSDYVIGAPFFKKMTIHLENGRDIVINAPNVSNKNKYIQSVTLNGQSYSKTTISHNTLAQGGTFTFDMGPQPSLWGSSSTDLPQSITPVSTNGSALYPKALVDLTNTAGSKKQDVATGSEGRSYGALFDNNSDTATLFRSSRPSIPVEFKKSKQRVTMYTLTSAANSGGTSDPKSWTLSGSNDGKKWEVLDNRSGQSFKWRSFTRAFSVSRPGYYRFYKLDITQNSGKSTPALAEFELLGYQDIGKGFSAIQNRLTSAFNKNVLSASQKSMLSATLGQAKQAFEDGNNSSAIAGMQNFVEQVNYLALGEGAAEIKAGLSADAHAIVNMLSDE